MSTIGVVQHCGTMRVEGNLFKLLINFRIISGAPSSPYQFEKTDQIQQYNSLGGKHEES